MKTFHIIWSWELQERTQTFWIWPDLSFLNYIVKDSYFLGRKDTLVIVVSDLMWSSHILETLQVLISFLLIFATYGHVVQVSKGVL